MTGPRILAIESSCDETGVAVVVGGRRIESNEVASQVALHAATGGIVPEVAARQQLRWIVPTLEAALDAAHVDWDGIDAVAVTYGPGLIGSLLVGVNVAKGLALAHDLPLVGVNHIEGHIYANWLTDAPADAPLPPEPDFPLLCLVVSGGHTQLVLMHDHGRYTLLGQTVDDAAGEAFDKVGRLLGLPYPGGPAISAAATNAMPATRFPRARTEGPYDFSFSGLKTAVLREVNGYRERGEPIPVSPSPIAIDVGVGLVWVVDPDGTVTRIDRSSGAALAPVAAGGALVDVLADGDRAWVADIEGGTVRSIDGATGEVGPAVTVPAGAVRLAKAGDRIWVTGLEDRVTPLDPATGAVGPAVRVGTGPIGVEATATALWVANSDDDTVSRLDPATGLELGPPIDVGDAPVAVAVTDRDVWVVGVDPSAAVLVRPT